MASQWHPGPPPAPGAWRSRWTARTSRPVLPVRIRPSGPRIRSRTGETDPTLAPAWHHGGRWLQCGIAVWIDQFAVCLPANLRSPGPHAFGWRQFGAVLANLAAMSLSTIESGSESHRALLPTRSTRKTTRAWSWPAATAQDCAPCAHEARRVPGRHAEGAVALRAKHAVGADPTSISAVSMDRSRALFFTLAFSSALPNSSITVR